MPLRKQEKPRHRLALLRWGVIILTLWAALALRLYRLDYQDIWWDEARNIDVATRPLAQVAVAPELDIHPPLYFYALHGWTKLAGRSSFATRFLSVWFGVLTVALVFQLGRRLGRKNGEMMGLLALLLAAFAPYALAEAQETRMYTLLWALLAAAMVALLRALDAEKWRGRWLLFGILAGAALITHYSVIFILAAWGLGLLAWALIRGKSVPQEDISRKAAKPPREKGAKKNLEPGRLDERWFPLSRAHWVQKQQRWQKLIWAGLTALLIFLPVLPIALRQIPGYNNPNLTQPGPGAYLLQLYRAFTMGEYVSPAIWAWGKALWAFALIGGAALQLGRRRHTTDWRTWRLLSLWLFGSLAIYYAVLLLRPAFNARYISFVLPPLWALSAWALTGWRRLARPLPWLALVFLLGISIPSLRADIFDPAHFREDMTGVTRYLAARATPQDIILVDQRYPFGFYWQRWNNDFWGTPPPTPADQAPAQYLFVDLEHLDQRLTQLAGNAQKVFWVTWYESDMDPRGAVPALLDAFGTMIDEQDFRGYKVRTWQLSPPTTFQLPADPQPLALRFDPGVVLVSGDWVGRQQPVAPGQIILIALQWQVQAPTQRPFKVSMRLKDASGRTLGQDDRPLLSNRHLRTPAWAPGETAINLYRLTAPSQPGAYQLAVVLYDEETLAATGVSDGSGIEPTIGSVSVVAPK